MRNHEHSAIVKQYKRARSSFEQHHDKLEALKKFNDSPIFFNEGSEESQELFASAYWDGYISAMEYLSRWSSLGIKLPKD